jgi:type IV fimbrial biogenesis protein FimT
MWWDAMSTINWTMRTIQGGWSLVELLAVMAIAAILSSLALPALRSMYHPLQVRNTAHEFAAWLAMARSEAIMRRNGRVVMCIASSDQGCDPIGDWRKGWLMFHDLNGNAQLDAQDTVIRYSIGLSEGLHAKGNTSVTRYVAYVPSGRALLVSGGLQMGTWSFCHEYNDTTGWQVVLNATGRARMARWTPDDC